MKKPIFFVGMKFFVNGVRFLLVNVSMVSTMVFKAFGERLLGEVYR